MQFLQPRPRNRLLLFPECHDYRFRRGFLLHGGLVLHFQPLP